MVVLRGFALEVVDGPGRGQRVEATGKRCMVGVHSSCDLVLADPAVSRFHCELTSGERRVRIRDLGSSNGTKVDGLRIRDADLRGGSLIGIGRMVIRFQYLGRPTHLRLSQRTEFGIVVGRSVSMRHLFSLLERAATSDLTILLQGETGTGKTATARSIHMESERRPKAFVMVDCSTLPGNLLESELFGHEKGAFTGAYGRRVGAFEEADGGTLFLDEIGELALDLQTKLLGALENREIRRLGSNRGQAVDVRVIAATNRDLRGEVNSGRFREDLYYRLSVIDIELPPLRERVEDLASLAESLLRNQGVPAERAAELLTPELLHTLQSSAWPGNVRELRNYLQRYLIFGPDMPTMPDASALPRGSPPPQQLRLDRDVAGDGSAATSLPSIPIDVTRTFSDARQKALVAFEQGYVVEIMRAHDGKVSRAADAAGINRTYLYRLLQRHKLPY
ncbi:MAG TPA: sigma 54-interacting transcriptional regulator [Kofleriaceae bacterium]|jgi:transcriptional regulator with GAF, ATPase, and Fis domain|nr:sigma 54-interacting transcriptional regulator [Kofleriaceae bacterium]